MIEIPIKLFKFEPRTQTHNDIKNEAINDGQPISLHNEIDQRIYYGHFISYA